jgi:hypothetical protein
MTVNDDADMDGQKVWPAGGGWVSKLEGKGKDPTYGSSFHRRNYNTFFGMKKRANPRTNKKHSKKCHQSKRRIEALIIIERE